MSAFPEPRGLVKSKTFWFNVVSAVIVPFLPAELAKPEYIGGFFVILNTVLRLVSKGKVELV